MQYTITIVDSKTRKPIAGFLTFYAGLNQARNYTPVQESGITIDIPGTITQVLVSSDGYYSYTARVDSLYDTTEVQLEKKPSIFPVLLVGIAVGVFGPKLIKSFN